MTFGIMHSAEAKLPSSKTSTRRANVDRPSLPVHLEREDKRIDVENEACPCCGGPLHMIGETVSEMLDHVPARNTVECVIRPIALGRKNHLFAGSDGGAGRWAIVASLLATVKLNNVEPFAYLKNVLERLSDGYPASRLDELLPWNWTELEAA